MNQNDRWQRIEELCQSALDCDASDRAAFLAAVCGSDIALLQEVEALLAHADAAESFLAEPAGHLAARAWAQDAPSMIGQQIAHYRIVERIGAGGMGVVYRAEDPRLKRSIALKFLPPDLTDDEHARRRFTGEARVLASFTHPHIAAIYGVEEFNGQNVLVLELIEGQTLANRIATGPIPVEEALPIAKQIAEALEAAHEKGIVHRDLKPSNIALTEEGTVKVLDFGIARATPTSSVPSDLISAPMQALPPLSTGTGVIVGTVAYMSPEQARGQVVDKRTDLWAFGCVLYEMLTGHAPFVGTNSTELLAAIVRDEPDWGALPPNTPQPIRRLLRRCLEKDRQRRLADAADARLEVDDAATGRPDKTGDTEARTSSARGSATCAHCMGRRGCRDARGRGGGHVVDRAGAE